MKKMLLVSAVLLMVLAIGTVGYAYAQAPEDPGTAAEAQTCPMHGRGPGQFGGMMGNMRGRSMMGQGYAAAGALHEYIQTALAGKLGLTAEELSERISAGESAWLIAEGQGMTLQGYREMMTEAHAEALAAAVADEVITQEQADLMQEHMQSRGERGFGPGSGKGKGGFRGGRGQ
jgi:hypothetical protein